jgi:hypothetical protein
VHQAALFIDAFLSQRKVITKNVKQHPLIPQNKLRGIQNHKKVAGNKIEAVIGIHQRTIKTNQLSNASIRSFFS